MIIQATPDEPEFVRQKGFLARVHRDGAVLLKDPQTPKDGYAGGLRLKFRLPIGFWLAVTARVLGRSPEGDGWDLAFVSTTPAEREMLASHVAIVSDPRERYAVELETIYEVRAGPGSVMILLAGLLGDQDAADLADALMQLRAKRLPLVLLNAAGFGTSAAGALLHLRRGLEALRHDEVAGVFTTPSSVADGQLRRVIREAGLAEALVSFSDVGEARRFWKGLLDARPVASDVRRRASSASQEALRLAPTSARADVKKSR